MNSISPKNLRLSGLRCTTVNIGSTTLNVPLFLVDAFNAIQHSLQSEGLFRKSCNATRVKNLKYPFLGNYGIPEGLSVGDVCYLIKQFFREIQEPLLTTELEPQFLKYHLMQHENTRIRYVLELCHVLPPLHRETLAFLMRKLRQISFFAEFNKMDIANLATVFWPSIFRSKCPMQDLSRFAKGNASAANQLFFEKKDVELKCALLQILIENAESIGVLSEYEKVMSPDMYERLLPEDRFNAAHGYQGNNKILWRLNRKKKNIGRDSKSFNQNAINTTPVAKGGKKSQLQKRLSLVQKDIVEPDIIKDFLENDTPVSTEVDNKPMLAVEKSLQINDNVPLACFVVQPPTKRKPTINVANNRTKRSSSGRESSKTLTPVQQAPRSISDSSFSACTSRDMATKHAGAGPLKATKPKPSPRKKLRRNTGRVSNKNRPASRLPVPEVNQAVTEDATLPAEREVFKTPLSAPICPTTPNFQENAAIDVFKTPLALPVCLLTPDIQVDPAPDVFKTPLPVPQVYPATPDNKNITAKVQVHQESVRVQQESNLLAAAEDFEHSDMIKSVLTSHVDNPADQENYVTTLKKVVNIHPPASVRPSVAYILKTRKGLVRENKALFEGIAKNLHDSLVSTPAASTENLQCSKTLQQPKLKDGDVKFEMPTLNVIEDEPEAVGNEENVNVDAAEMGMTPKTDDQAAATMPILHFSAASSKLRDRHVGTSPSSPGGRHRNGNTPGQQQRRLKRVADKTSASKLVNKRYPASPKNPMAAVVRCNRLSLLSALEAQV